jgi:diacylglycerol kinase family enzyme
VEERPPAQEEGAREAQDRAARAPAPLTGRVASPPFLLVNPRSGGAEPSAAELAAAARRLGVETRELQRGEDAAALAAAAADRGAEALGVAGGDGTLAAVAEAALVRDLPFVPIPFGTRNHFARDAGLDRDDPIGALEAFDGRERRVDVGAVDGRLFLNNVSLGLYASMVHAEKHDRRTRAGALARILPAAFGRGRRPLELSFEVSGRHERRWLLMLVVANNDYGIGSLADLTERERLDEGLLHAYALEAVGRARLVALLARAAADRLEGAAGWMEWAAPRFRVESRRERIRAALDGEPVVLRPPLDFEVKKGALRVLVPA